MSSKSKTANVIRILQEDAEIKAIISQAKSIKTNHKMLKAEIEKFVVGAAPFRINTNFDYEKTLTRLHRIQAYLDRLTEIRSDLIFVKGTVYDLYQSASVLLSSFDAVQKVRTASQRDEFIDEILLPISKRRDRIEELLDVIESTSWNLRNTHSIITTQIDLAKHIFWTRNPEKYLDGNSREKRR